MNTFDIIILTILAVCTVLGGKRGLITTLCGLVVTVAALIFSPMIADQCAPAAAEMIRPPIQAAIQQQLDASLAAEKEQDGVKVLVPETGSVLEQIMESDLYLQLSELADKTSQNITQNAAGEAAARLSVSIAWILVYLLSFAAINVIGNLAAGVLNLAAMLPGLHMINSGLGAVCGFAKGVIVAAIISGIAVGFGLISQAQAENSILLEMFSVLGSISL